MSAFCGGCGARYSDGNRFCVSCGSARDAGALSVATSERPTTAIPTGRAEPIPHTVVTGQIDARVRLASGAACPECFSALYYRKFTFWHFLIAICLFPIGLLFLLAPVQKCENGHSYGLGKWIINIIVGILLSIIVVLSLIAYAFSHRGETTSVGQSNDSTLHASAVSGTDASIENSTPSTSLVDSQGTAAATGDLAAVAAKMIRTTAEMKVLGTDSDGCDGSGGLAIRFKDDGTGGCAAIAHAISGTLQSGVATVLIPVLNSQNSVVFGLMYVKEAESQKFIGILPGDGTGHLDISIEDGLIVERNGARVKRSTYQSGRVVQVNQ